MSNLLLKLITESVGCSLIESIAAGSRVVAARTESKVDEFGFDIINDRVKQSIVDSFENITGTPTPGV